MPAFPLRKWLACQVVLLDPRLKPSEAVLFVRLVDHHNTRSNLCCPGQGRLARDLGASERSIRSWLRNLERLGYIRKTSRSSRYLSDHYALWFPNGESEYKEAEAECCQRRKAVSAKPMKEPLKEQSGKDRRISTRARDAADGTSDRPLLRKEDQSQLQDGLLVRLGGGERAWEILMEVDSDVLDEVEERIHKKEISLHEAEDRIIDWLDAWNQGRR